MPKGTELIELESSLASEILIPILLASLRGGHPIEKRDDFDGEFTGCVETSHLREECGF